jgi:hypothetical protein
MTAAMREVLTVELIERLRDAGLDPQEVTRIVSAALDEDLAGRTDVTTEATIPAGSRSTAYLTARADGVVAGLAVAETVFRVATARSVPPAGGATSAAGVPAAQPFGGVGPGGRPPGPPDAGGDPPDPLMPAQPAGASLSSRSAV